MSRVALLAVAQDDDDAVQLAVLTEQTLAIQVARIDVPDAHSSLSCGAFYREVTATKLFTLHDGVVSFAT
jgi:hypothetical protein